MYLGAKVITIHHNCEIEYNRDNCEHGLGKLYHYWTQKYEGEAVQKSDLNLVLTSQDESLLHLFYDKENKKKIVVLGCFEYKIESYKVYNRTRKLQKFIITGNLSARQTEESLLFWLEKYYPILKNVIPNSMLTIAGKSPSKELEKVCNSLNVELIASPVSMMPILADADVYLCPTSLGGGLKLRIMDGLKNS